MSCPGLISLKIIHFFQDHSDCHISMSSICLPADVPDSVSWPGIQRWTSQARDLSSWSFPILFDHVESNWLVVCRNDIIEDPKNLRQRRECREGCLSYFCFLSDSFSAPGRVLMFMILLEVSPLCSNSWISSLYPSFPEFLSLSPNPEKGLVCLGSLMPTRRQTCHKYLSIESNESQEN